MITCKNCQTSFEGKFCPACGQKGNSGGFSFRQVSKHLLSDVLSWDAPLLKTFAGLMRRPGQMAAAYIRGQRVRYYRPIQFFVITLGIFLLVRTLTGFDPIDNQYKAFNMPQPPDQEISGQHPGRWLSRHINTIAFVLVFSYAFFSRLFFWRSQFNFAENLVFGFYAVGNYLVFSTIFVLLSFINPKLFYLLYPTIILYLTICMIGFHGKISFFTIVKALLATLLSYVLYVTAVYQFAVFFVTYFG